jgi:hypothetical protein
VDGHELLGVEAGEIGPHERGDVARAREHGPEDAGPLAHEPHAQRPIDPMAGTAARW